MEVTKTDLARLETVMKILKRGKYELEGEEVLAFAQAFHWVSATFDKITQHLATPPPADTPKKAKGK
jgi:hypothetical protein